MVDSTLKFFHVKAPPVSRGEQFMSDIERGHNSDAFGAGYFAAVPDITHFLVEISHRLQQLLALFVRTGDAEFASHDDDINGLRSLHSSLSGICNRIASRREAAALIFSV